jgi:hypothetical protein
MIKRILDAAWNIAAGLYILLLPLLIIIVTRYYDTHPTIGHVIRDAELFSTALKAFGIVILSFSAIGMLLYMKNMTILRRSSSRLLSEARLLVMNSNIGIKYRNNLEAIQNIKIAPILSLSIGGSVNPDNLKVVYLNVVLNLSRRAMVTVLAHEMVHLLQYDYYTNMAEMYTYFSKRIGYERNPLEVEARSVQPMNRRKMILSGNKLIKAQDMIINYLRD